MATLASRNPGSGIAALAGPPTSSRPSAILPPPAPLPLTKRSPSDDPFPCPACRRRRSRAARRCAGFGAAHGPRPDQLFAEPAVGGARAATDQQSDHLAAERGVRSEEHTSELQSLMRISYAVFCL